MKRLFKQRDFTFLLLALLLLGIVFFQPTIQWKRDLHHYLLIVDITQSMNATDMRLNGQAASRLDYTRQLLGDAIARMPCGTKVSLGVFSAETIALLFTPIEVCKNYDVIQDSIANLEWRMAWRGNSRLRFGVQSAAALLSSLDTAAQVVFFTDGDEAPKLNAINKSDLSAWQGGKGWLIVGVGGDQPVPIPKLDSENKVLGYWAFSNSIMAPSQVQSEESIGTRDDSIATAEYDRYLSQLDETYLRELSAEIGATYLRAITVDVLINKMKQQKPVAKERAEIDMSPFLISAALLLVLACYSANLQSRFRHIFPKGQQ
ncbi:MAG: VWA domain-containing protein [Nitrosomonadales bacterium]|nr:VWA domain-containing protein [Nitrosomonadales bacterium]